MSDLIAHMTAMTIEPYSDNADDFAHLDKIAIKLLLCGEDNEGNDFTNRDIIELSRFDSLFERLTRKAPFPSWRRLTIMPRRFQVYKYEGANWFESNPDLIRRDVQNCIRQFQYNLHTMPPQMPQILVLEV